MNQIREWEGECQRCSVKTGTYTMSMFDVSLICFDCADSEKKYPKYSEARQADEKAIREGNFNFEGIGQKKDESG